MGYDPKDADLMHLLRKLKEDNAAYPKEMLALRRQGYLKQVAEISGGAGLVFGLKHLAQGGKAAGIPPVTGTVIELILVVALLAEAGAMAYFYRDKLSEYFSFSNQPRVEEVSTLPLPASPIPEIELTPSPVPAATKTRTPSSTPGTPFLEVAGDPTRQSEENITNQTVSTPEPDTTKGNNGNHYGQTPKPERTKDSGNDSNDNQQKNTKTPKKKK